MFLHLHYLFLCPILLFHILFWCSKLSFLFFKFQCCVLHASSPLHSYLSLRSAFLTQDIPLFIRWLLFTLSLHSSFPQFPFSYVVPFLTLCLQIFKFFYSCAHIDHLAPKSCTLLQFPVLLSFLYRALDFSFPWLFLPMLWKTSIFPLYLAVGVFLSLCSKFFVWWWKFYLPPTHAFLSHTKTS